MRIQRKIDILDHILTRRMNKREFISLVAAALASAALPLRFLTDVVSTTAISAMVPANAEHGDLLISFVAQNDRLVTNYKIHDGLSTGWTRLSEKVCPTGDQKFASMAAFSGCSDE